MISPLTLQYAQEAARCHNTSASAVFSTDRTRRVVAARWQVWRWLSADGLSPRRIGEATGHDRTSVLHGLGMVAVSRPAPDRPASDTEARQAVQAAAAAMLAKHQREVESRY